MGPEYAGREPYPADMPRKTSDIEDAIERAHNMASRQEQANLTLASVYDRLYNGPPAPATAPGVAPAPPEPTALYPRLLSALERLNGAVCHAQDIANNFQRLA